MSKTIEAYVIKAPDGKLNNKWIGHSIRRAQLAFYFDYADGDHRDWDYWYRKGYRCVRVRMNPHTLLHGGNPYPKVYKCSKQSGKWMPSIEDGSSMAIVGCASHSASEQQRIEKVIQELEQWKEGSLIDQFDGTEYAEIDIEKIERAIAILRGEQG